MTRQRKNKKRMGFVAYFFDLVFGTMIRSTIRMFGFLLAAWLFFYLVIWPMIQSKISFWL